MCDTRGMADNPEIQQFAADWSGADVLEAQIVNQVLGQVGVPEPSGPDGIYLTFGAISPPIVVGTPEMISAQLARYDGKLKVKPVSRIRLTREKAVELVQLIQATIAQHDAQTEAARSAKTPAGDTAG